MARTKVTKDEYKKRIMLVSRKIVEGENTTELAENISIQFSVTIRQAWNYIRDAKEQLVAISVDSKEALFAEHIAVRRSLRKRAAKAGDLRTELAVVQDEAKLFDLYSPERFAIEDWRREVAEKGIDAGELFEELVNRLSGVVNEND